ncbi:MAG TPA: hypothetical protein VFL69_13020 [Marmoricola sp.]|nr:hypothetical protein [Marmoricola sp.]
MNPDLSIEVDDVHDRAVTASAEIVYPLTDEEGAAPLLRAGPQRGRDQRDPAGE